MVNRSIIGRKVSFIQDYLARVKTLPNLSLQDFKKNLTAQDVLLFNLTQSIQGCIGVATHIVSDEGWGIPGTQSDAFEILKDKEIISDDLLEKLVAMVGFRNRVIHEYEELHMDIVYDIWQHRIIDIERFCLSVVERFG